jgi:hypothetical protein
MLRVLRAFCCLLLCVLSTFYCLMLFSYPVITSPLLNIASMSGVHGLATTFGRIPFHNHTDSTMIKAGPLAASAQDVALTMAAIAQNAPGTFYTDLYDGGINGPPPPHLGRFLDIEDLSVRTV